MTVTLSEPAPKDGVQFAVTAGSDGSASAGDVGTITSPVTASQGDTTLEVSIPTVADAIDEDDETFTVTVTALTDGWAAAGDGQNTATVTIIDDDTAAVTVTAPRTRSASMRTQPRPTPSRSPASPPPK